MRARLIASLLTLLVGLPRLACGATTWACTRDFDSVQPGFYFVGGFCTALTGSTYTNPGGDPIGVSTSVADTATALCNSPARVARDVILQAAFGNTGTAATLAVFNPSTRNLQLFFPGGGGANTFATELTNGAVTAGFVIRFIALCS